MTDRTRIVTDEGRKFIDQLTRDGYRTETDGKRLVCIPPAGGVIDDNLRLTLAWAADELIAARLARYPRDEDTGAVFTPLAPTLANPRTARVHLLRQVVEAAERDGWSSYQTEYALRRASRQPAYTLADDSTELAEVIAQRKAQHDCRRTYIGLLDRVAWSSAPKAKPKPTRKTRRPRVNDANGATP